MGFSKKKNHLRRVFFPFFFFSLFFFCVYLFGSVLWYNFVRISYYPRVVYIQEVFFFFFFLCFIYLTDPYQCCSIGGSTVKRVMYAVLFVEYLVFFTSTQVRNPSIPYVVEYGWGGTSVTH